MEKVAILFADVFGVQPEIVQAGTTPEQIENWDSVKHLELILEIESRFQISLEMKEIFEIEQAGDVAAILDRHGVLEGE